MQEKAESEILAQCANNLNDLRAQKVLLSELKMAQLGSKRLIFCANICTFEKRTNFLLQISSIASTLCNLIKKNFNRKQCNNKQYLIRNYDKTIDSYQLFMTNLEFLDLFFYLKNI